MPRVAFDYSKTEIYKIIHINPEVNLSYVGHTTNFIQRKREHKSCANNNKELNLYTTINANGGWGNFKMIFVEKFKCANRREAEAREQFWMDELKPNMNSNFAQRSQKEYNKEYYQENKEQMKAWREDNKELIKKEASKPFECACGSTVRWGEKARHFRTKNHILNT